MSLKILRVFLWCALTFVTLVEIVEFVVHRNVFIMIMPQILVNTLAANNDAFMEILTANPYRNGMYRASSVYGVSLSFAEFEAMMIPFRILLSFLRSNRARANGRRRAHSVVPRRYLRLRLPGGLFVVLRRNHSFHVALGSSERGGPSRIEWGRRSLYWGESWGSLS